MGLTLKDGVYHVRTEIGELEEFYWSDNQIIFDLNHAARRMCNTAGNLTKYQAVQLSINGDGSQEAPLDEEVNTVKACSYFSGQLFDLEPHDWKSLQTGAAVGSIPRWYYLKTDTLQLTPQNTGTSNISEYPIGPNNPFGTTYRTVVGVWPIPPEPAELHVWYSYIHRWMQDPLDPCAVYENYLEAWASYAIARCYRMQKAYAEAQEFMDKFVSGEEAFRVWQGKQRNSDQPARYGITSDPWRQSASSSVIFVDPSPSM